MKPKLSDCSNPNFWSSYKNIWPLKERSWSKFFDYIPFWTMPDSIFVSRCSRSLCLSSLILITLWWIIKNLYLFFWQYLGKFPLDINNVISYSFYVLLSYWINLILTSNSNHWDLLLRIALKLLHAHSNIQKYANLS